MKVATIACLIMLGLAAFLSILQMWVPLFEWHIYLKVIATLGIMSLVILGIALARRDYLQDAKLRDDGYID